MGATRLFVLAAVIAVILGARRRRIDRYERELGIGRHRGTGPA